MKLKKVLSSKTRERELPSSVCKRSQKQNFLTSDSTLIPYRSKVLTRFVKKKIKSFFCGNTYLLVCARYLVIFLLKKYFFSRKKKNLRFSLKAFAYAIRTRKPQSENPSLKVYLKVLIRRIFFFTIRVCLKRLRPSLRLQRQFFWWKKERSVCV